MESLIQTLPQIAGYLPALQALTVLCLIVLARGSLQVRWGWEGAKK